MEKEITSVKSVVSSIFYEYLGKTGTGILDFVGHLIMALLILIIGFRLIKYVVRLCTRVFERSNMDLTLQTFLLSFIKIGLKILVVLWAVTRIGVTASSIIAVVGSAGIALGLSLQGSLSNIAGGVILLLMKPFQVGDYIVEDSSGKEGTVQAIGIMYTKLLSVDNKAILVPNGNLTNASITNVTFQEHRRVDLLIGIEYSEDVRRVKELLSSLVEEEPSLLPEEPVQIYVSDFKESCIDIGVRYWVKTEEYWESRWRILENIKYAFDENGISIPFNQLDVNIITGKPENKDTEKETK